MAGLLCWGRRAEDQRLVRRPGDIDIAADDVALTRLRSEHGDRQATVRTDLVLDAAAHVGDLFDLRAQGAAASGDEPLGASRRMDSGADRELHRVAGSEVAPDGPAGIAALDRTPPESSMMTRRPPSAGWWCR